MSKSYWKIQKIPFEKILSKTTRRVVKEVYTRSLKLNLPSGTFYNDTDIYLKRNKTIDTSTKKRWFRDPNTWKMESYFERYTIPMRNQLDRTEKDNIIIKTGKFFNDFLKQEI